MFFESFFITRYTVKVSYNDRKNKSDKKMSYECADRLLLCSILINILQFSI